MFKFKDLIDNATLISIVFSFFFTGPAFAADPVKNSRRPAPFVGADLQKLTCRGAEPCDVPSPELGLCLAGLGGDDGRGGRGRNLGSL